MVKCPHAASGCDYPASECAGHCTSKQQPEALRLAELLDTCLQLSAVHHTDAAAELRRLCSQNQELLLALQALTHSLDYEDLLHDDQRKAFKHARAIIQVEGEAK